MPEVGPVSRRTFLQRMAAAFGAAAAAKIAASAQPVPPGPEPSAKPENKPAQDPWKNHITTYCYDPHGHVVKIIENGADRAVLPYPYEYRPTGSGSMRADDL